MTLLIIGIIAFIGLHLIPYFAIEFRNNLIGKLGKLGYRGIFALAVALSMAAIIFGWRGTDPGFVYANPSWGFHVTPLLVLIGFLLFFASNAPTNIKRAIRHPQMTGILLWAVGHLFSNGEARSVLLFGGFALWSIIAIIAANRRDGMWIKPEKQPVIKDVITIIIALVAYGAFTHFHETIIGVRPFP
ncbi:NnrU family protein [Kordiimonas aquimaris]|uniref:NnrU family protein n=1 Tax=Kordiimonas aquimaris TaxID=707591 RepID=UPI0021D30BF9|nr:NnrU family protein [Kordiimonas aquimaris]